MPSLSSYPVSDLVTPLSTVTFPEGIWALGSALEGRVGFGNLDTATVVTGFNQTFVLTNPDQVWIAAPGEIDEWSVQATIGLDGQCAVVAAGAGAKEVVTKFCVDESGMPTFGRATYISLGHGPLQKLALWGHGDFVSVAANVVGGIWYAKIDHMTGGIVEQRRFATSATVQNIAAGQIGFVESGKSWGIEISNLGQTEEYRTQTHQMLASSQKPMANWIVGSDEQSVLTLNEYTGRPEVHKQRWVNQQYVNYQMQFPSEFKLTADSTASLSLQGQLMMVSALKPEEGLVYVTLLSQDFNSDWGILFELDDAPDEFAVALGDCKNGFCSLAFHDKQGNYPQEPVVFVFSESDRPQIPSGCQKATVIGGVDSYLTRATQPSTGTITAHPVSYEDSIEEKMDIQAGGPTKLQDNCIVPTNRETRPETSGVTLAQTVARTGMFSRQPTSQSPTTSPPTAKETPPPPTKPPKEPMSPATKWAIAGGCVLFVAASALLTRRHIENNTDRSLAGPLNGSNEDSQVAAPASGSVNSV